MAIMLTKSVLRSLFPSFIKNFLNIYRFAIIAIIFAGFLLIKTSINQKAGEIENILINSAKQTQKTVAYDINYVKHQLFYASTQIALMNGDKEKIHKLLSTFLTTNSQVDVAVTWSAFSWIDSQKKLTIDGTSGIISKPIDLSDRDYLKYTEHSLNKVIFGQAVYGVLSQRLLIPAGLGTFSSDGKYIGTLVFGFDIEKLVSKIEKTVENENISFAFFHEGEFIFASENFENDFLEPIKDDIHLASLDDNIDRKKISTQKIFADKVVNAYFQRIKGQPIEFVLFYDKDAYYKQIIDIIFRQVVIIFLAMVCCIILFRSLYRRIVKPVSHLSIFAQRISERDFSYQIEEPEGKELKELYIALKMLGESCVREESLMNRLKNANQKIAQENFNKSEFLSAISHDIRNPLSAILAFTKNLQNKESDNEEESLKEIENCANDALEFINDLMDVTQISSGIFSINLSQKINIYEMIKRSIRVNRDFANKKHIRIFNHANSDLPAINLDQRRIKQILINLVNNSIKYSRENTKIEILASDFCENGKNKLRISIKDEGMGMTDKQLEKAMQKFGLAEESKNNDKVDSFGLGLNLVKQLVELQGGRIEIRSKIGAGTMIIITFDYKD